MKQKILFILLFLVWQVVRQEVGGSESFEVIPSGTRLAIPSAIMKRYQAERGWGMPFNYLSYHYAVPMPSTLVKDGWTYYVPLSYVDKNNQTKVIMMDLMNIKIDEDYKFTTIKLINVGKNTYTFTKKRKLLGGYFDFIKDDQIHVVELCMSVLRNL